MSPQRVSRLLLVHGDQRRAHRLLLAEPAGGALHHPRPPTLLLQLHAGAAGVHRPAGRHAHPPHPHPRLPHAGHGGAGGLVQQAQRHPGLAVTRGVRGHGRTDGFGSDLPSAGCSSLMLNRFCQDLRTGSVNRVLYSCYLMF